MKMPKECRRFCARCKKHTTHVMSIYKKGKERSTKEGTRRHAARKEGYGGQKFPELAKTAKTIAFIASPAANYINGVSLAVDGGRLTSI